MIRSHTYMSLPNDCPVQRMSKIKKSPPGRFEPMTSGSKGGHLSLAATEMRCKLSEFLNSLWTFSGTVSHSEVASTWCQTTIFVFSQMNNVCMSEMLLKSNLMQIKPYQNYSLDVSMGVGSWYIVHRGRSYLKTFKLRLP
jgi:hypothetical protein